MGSHLAGTELEAFVDDPSVRASVSMQDAIEGFLGRTEQPGRQLSAFISVTADIARRDAAAIDAARAEGHQLPLDGVVVAVKDNIDVAGVPTTVGSRFFQDPAVDDSVAVRRLRDAGAIIIGKTNLHEFVFGGTTNNPYYGTCRNPWDPERIPGGSSGGSGVAVAIDACVAALGSDTGGSVRIPAGFCGVAGLRPSYGRVSNRGSFPLSRSFDAIGPMARSVADMAKVFAVLEGYDRADPRSVKAEVANDFTSLDGGIAEMRIGVARRFFFDGVDDDVGAAVEAAIGDLESLGASVVEVEVPGAAEASDISNPIIWAEAYEVHEKRLAEQPDWFGDDTRRRLEMGKQVTGSEFASALERMARYQRALEDLFSTVEVVLTPMTAAPPPRIDDAETVSVTAELVRLNHQWSLGHVPALVLPCGFTKSGLPVAMQLAARRWGEVSLLRLGMAYQGVTEWHRARAPVVQDL